MEYANELERGQMKLLRAKMLMSVGNRAEAETSLSEAENVFRRLRNDDYLSDVLITKSQMHLCQSRVSLALNDIEEALSIGEGSDPAKRGQMLFYRGLAFLAMGKEDEAHQDLNEYVRIAETQDDMHAQTLGRFYHALAFERHREPCMASAELEIAKELVQDDDPSLKGRLDAFIAHLWLRRGEVDEAEALETETLKLISGDVERVGPANLGMAFLIRAEILAMRSHWKESSEIFEETIQIFRTSRYGLYFEALALAWYGETLLTLGREEDGSRTLLLARDIYSRMTNDSQVIKIDTIMSSLRAKAEPMPTKG
jgi:tetratricopeptide (TPR) repeat protein